MVPDRRSLGVLAGAFGLAYLTFFWPALQAHAWAMLIGLGALIALDLLLTRVRLAPMARLEAPRRARTSRKTELQLELTNPDRSIRRVRILVELPGDLGGDAEFGPLRLSAMGTQHISLPVTPSRRGLRPIGPVDVLTRSVLGLYWRRSRGNGDDTLAVLPDPGRTAERMRGDQRLLSRRVGIRPRRRRGEGFEFESLREYVRGDDPRHIDWKATARAAKPMVRQHQIERNHDVLVAVETGRLMSTRIDGVSKLDHALNATVALAHAARAAGDRLGFVAFDREVRSWVPPLDSRAGLSPLLDATLPLMPRGYEPHYRALAELIAARQKKRSLLIVLGDVAEGPTSATLESYLALLGRRHCVLFVALRDPLFSAVDQPAPEIDQRALLQRLVIQDLLVDREITLARLRRLGVLSLDLHPEHATAPVLDRYLAIREAGLL